MTYIPIGEKLKATRKSKGLTTQQVAEKLGFTQSYISRFENNKAVPDIEILTGLLNIYETSISEFFAEDAPEVSPELQALLSNAKSLNTEQLRKLNDFIKSMQ